MRDRCCIVGVGTTAYGKRGAFADRAPVDLVREAFEAALADAGLERRDVDGLATYSVDQTDPALLARSLGLPHVDWSSVVHGGGGGGTCGAVGTAAAAIVAGLAEVVLVYKTITQPPQARFGAAYGSPVVAADPMSDFHIPFGLVSPVQFMALLLRRHMHRYGTTPRHLAEVAVQTRAHARRNPRALKREPLTIDDHQASRMIADPFRLYDCCQENDGGAALLVTSAERARDLRQRPIHVMSVAMGGDSAWGQGLTTQSQPEALYATAGHAHLAERLWKRAGVGPADVDVALLYDHFSGMVLLQLEDYGFCARGESGPFVEDGGLAFDGGRLPVNTHGGNLSEVYLLGMTHVIEGVRQLRGQSTAQVPDAEIALVTAGPSNLPSSSMVLRR